MQHWQESEGHRLHEITKPVSETHIEKSMNRIELLVHNLVFNSKDLFFQDVDVSIDTLAD